MRIRGFAAALALLAWSSSLVADEEASAATQLIAEVRERIPTLAGPTQEGRDAFRFAPATLLAQGEVVYYTVRIHNPTPMYLRDVIVTQRIPANTTYVAGSAAAPAAAVSFSVDGGQTFRAAADLIFEVEGRAQPAAPEHYTHIRWKLRHPLAPGAVALARFRAVFQ